MYKVQEKPDDTAKLCNGSVVTPLVTLRDEHGGVSHIIMDDHCYVLIQRKINGGDGQCCNMVKHWYKEAMDALVKWRCEQGSVKLGENVKQPEKIV